MGRELFTVGYQGVTIEGFIDNLHANNIKCILDVRAYPLSRKPGFSKNILTQKLNRAKIKYVHLGELGAPKSFRDDLKLTGDYSDFFKKMNVYLASKKDTIEEAYRYVTQKRCCLMCFEQLATQCHRKIVAKKIKVRDKNGLQIKHL